MIRVLSVACFLNVAVVVALPPLVTPQTKQGPAASNPEKRQWGKAVEGQAISIATDKTVYAPGDRIVLTTTLKNVGRKDVEFWERGPLATYEVKVLLPSEKEAPLTLYGQQAARAAKGGGSVFGGPPLKSGEENSSSLVVSRFFDFSLSGKYKISERRFVGRDPASKEPYYAVSNEITIIVEEPPAKR